MARPDGDGPVRRASEYALEFAVEQPLRHLPDSQVLVDGVTTFYRKVTQDVFGKRTGRERWPETEGRSYRSSSPASIMGASCRTRWRASTSRRCKTSRSSSWRAAPRTAPPRSRCGRCGIREGSQDLPVEPTRVRRTASRDCGRRMANYITFPWTRTCSPPRILEKAMALKLLGVDVVYPPCSSLAVSNGCGRRRTSSRWPT